MRAARPPPPTRVNLAGSPVPHSRGIWSAPTGGGSPGTPCSTMSCISRSCIAPRAERRGGVMRRVFARGQAAETALDVRDALDSCAKIALELRASLARYEPLQLGVYRDGGTCCSSLLEYLGLLANGEWQRMPLPRGPVAEALIGTRLLFGHEAIEYRTPAHTRIGAMLGIKEYPTPCFVGIFDK